MRATKIKIPIVRLVVIPLGFWNLGSTKKELHSALNSIRILNINCEGIMIVSLFLEFTPQGKCLSIHQQSWLWICSKFESFAISLMIERILWCLYIKTYLSFLWLSHHTWTDGANSFLLVVHYSQEKVPMKIKLHRKVEQFRITLKRLNKFGWQMGRPTS